MMKITTKIPITVAFLISLGQMNAQSEGLTSSPYSLYGLGAINQTSVGAANSMGYSGIGLRTDSGINNLNPATYALIPQNSFFYDVGVVGEFNSFENQSDTESKTTLNFSNLAFAFRIEERLGAGIALIPYSDVGYSLLGIQTNIEGSSEVFESNVTGLGGLNDLRVNIGYGPAEKIRLGFSASLLFGNIEENEFLQVGSGSLEITETTNYSGFRFGFGAQFDLTDKITLGSTIQLPVSLSGNLVRSANKTILDSEVVVAEDDGGSVDSFKLPLEFGVGLGVQLTDYITMSADYKRNFWNDTDQTENIGAYQDQDIYALGLEYVKNPMGRKYSERIRLRTGINYDNGYLAINDRKIEGYNFTLGVGLPTGRFANSLLNLSYSYGSKGQIENVLVQENYHVLTLNFSLEDLWFKKRKIN
ncbi:OmpP1/FadL family transporter [Flagellimonas flava]|uniref:OmpP1/FadL family transporter n=1 Tax=Flagellimonas flava TaxID=570519 RepID=UPI003D662375